MENWPRNIFTNFYLGSAYKISSCMHANSPFQDFYRDKIKESEQIEIHLQVVASQIEKTLDILVDKLPLRATLLDEYLPIMLREGFIQLNVSMVGSMHNASLYDSYKLVGNNFIQEALRQMALLAKDCPITLLAWLVVLCKFAELISHTNDLDRCDSIGSIWEGIAVGLIDEAFDSNKISYYLAWLSSLLLKS